MKAGIVFTGTGPILVLTTYKSFTDPAFVEKMARKGILKFMVYELDLDSVRQRYGTQFEVIAEDVESTDDLRVLDYNGHNIFYKFSFREMTDPIMHE